jgi:NADH:ubiquinone oxidoreductase subunit K
MIPLEFELTLSVILFAIGFYGFLVKKNAIIVLMCIEIILNAAIMNFVAFASYAGDPAGQVFALMAISLAAAEAAVGLGIFLVLYRTHGNVELDKIRILRW